MIEFGGANSCFARALTLIPIERYYAADLNRLGLRMLKERRDLPGSIVPVHADVLNPDAELPKGKHRHECGPDRALSPAGHATRN